jgi:hypothetical protein
MPINSGFKGLYFYLFFLVGWWEGFEVIRVYLSLVEGVSFSPSFVRTRGGFLHALFWMWVSLQNIRVVT